MKRILIAVLVLAFSEILSAAVGPNESRMTISLPKNTAGKLYVYAHDNDDGTAETGDAANIDAFVSIDGAAEAALTDTAPDEIDATNSPGWYVFDLTAAETNGTQALYTVKSATATIEVSDVVATFHTVVAAGAIPNATAGAAGGLLIAGTNTGNVVIAPTAGVPLTLTAGTGNSAGLIATGTGTGSGISATGGATGDGMTLTGGATSGNGLYASTPTSGYGIWAAGGGGYAGLGAFGGATGHGIEAEGGGTSGSGIFSVANTAGYGMYLGGVGAYSGFYALGGNNASGHGMKLSRGNAAADDLNLANSDAPTMVTALGTVGIASITSSVNATGSTAKLIVLDTNPTTWGDLSRCWCVYYKASTALYYPGVVTAYDATAGTVQIFPSLPFTPLTADTITIYPSIGSLIRKDFPAPNNLYFDPDVNP